MSKATDMLELLGQVPMTRVLDQMSELSMGYCSVTPRDDEDRVLGALIVIQGGEPAEAVLEAIHRAYDEQDQEPPAEQSYHWIALVTSEGLPVGMGATLKEAQHQARRRRRRETSLFDTDDPAELATIREDDDRWFASLTEARVSLTLSVAVDSNVVAGVPAILTGLIGEYGGRCRVCGCTNEYGCPEGCAWVADDLCSACVADDGFEEA